MNDIRFKTYYKDKWYLVPKINMWSCGIDDLPYKVDLVKLNDQKSFEEHEELFDVEIDYNDLLQFTGLTDSKGQDIYEGDIVEFVDDVGNGEDCYTLKLKAEVIFENGEFTLNLDTDELVESSFNANECKLKEYADYMTVVGNVYE